MPKVCSHVGRVQKPSLAGSRQTPGPPGHSVPSAAPIPFGERSSTMRKATATLMSVLFAATLTGCDTKASSDTWHLTNHGVVLLKAGAREPVRISLPGWVWAGEPYGCGPALALGPGGEAVITSDVVPVVWRVDPASLRVSVHALELDRDTDKDVG